MREGGPGQKRKGGVVRSITEDFGDVSLTRIDPQGAGGLHGRRDGRTKERTTTGRTERERAKTTGRTDGEWTTTAMTGHDGTRSQI